jgi:hypothetical protein
MIPEVDANLTQKSGVSQYRCRLLLLPLVLLLLLVVCWCRRHLEEAKCTQTHFIEALLHDLHELRTCVLPERV